MQKKAAYISFDLAFDYHSYLFCMIRSFLCQKQIHIDNKFRAQLEEKNQKKCFEIIKNDQQIIDNLKKQKDPQTFLFEDFKKNCDKYISTVKPQVGIVDLIDILQVNQYRINIGLENYDELQHLQLDQIKEGNKDWMENIEFSKAQKLDAESFKDFEIVISGDIQWLKQLSEKQQNSNQRYLQIKNSDFHKNKSQNEDQQEGENKQQNRANIFSSDLIENIDFKKYLGIETSYKFPQKEYFLNLKSQPNDKSYKGFKGSYKLENAIEVSGEVVKGKGQAGKELGIRTANIDIKNDIVQELIKDLPTGVYLGKAVLHSKTYHSLIFIGSSQYFESSIKQLEAYLYEDFEEDFYEEQISISIQYFQRPEADFKAFDHLIKYIHNDVWQGKYIFEQIQN